MMLRVTLGVMERGLALGQTNRGINSGCVT